MCIKEIKALYNNRGDSKKTRLKGMNEFLEAESEVSQMEAAAMTEPDEEAAEEPFVRRSRSIVAKRP